MECAAALEIVTSGQKKSWEVWTLESFKSMLTEVTENFAIAKLQEKEGLKLGQKSALEDTLCGQDLAVSRENGSEGHNGQKILQVPIEYS